MKKEVSLTQETPSQYNNKFCSLVTANGSLNLITSVGKNSTITAVLSREALKYTAKFQIHLFKP